MHYEPLLQAGRLSFVNLSFFLLHPKPAPAVGQASSLSRFWFVRWLFERLGNVLDREGLDFIPFC
jgi:hypothetical protein